MAFWSLMKFALSGTVALALTVQLAIAAPDGRASLEGISAVRVANYGAPSKLLQQRDEVAPIVEELSELRKKHWRKGDTKMRCARWPCSACGRIRSWSGRWRKASRATASSLRTGICRG
ncbi:MAG: hypothetical protein E6H63_02955 [Betaproteobacteria bacterium]|nr:MAG: hypothetical protein E6H63_02955 [Betaproteobacteria bacterium]